MKAAKIYLVCSDSVYVIWQNKVIRLSLETFLKLSQESPNCEEEMGSWFELIF